MPKRSVFLVSMLAQVATTRLWSLSGLCVTLLVTLPFPLLAIDAAKLPPPASKPVEFTKEIKPILDRHCADCHSAAKQRGGFRIDLKSAALKGGENHAPAIVPGKSSESPLIHFVAGLVADMIMPEKGERLTSEQIALLRAWIDQGAQWPDEKPPEEHWSFKPVVRPVIPKTRNSRWARNPIDSFVLARLEEKKLSPSKEADRRTLIRRVTFDLTGLPPTPAEVDEFIKDRSADAYEKVVDRLLASPRYGERWARHWLDVVRFAETTGYEVNTPRDNAWPYRDYVIRSFNDDKPYDQFVIEQLAGDTVRVEEATGFIVGGPNDRVKSPDIVLTRQQRSDELHDMVSTTGSAFLGLTVGCARCHNHKFDPISQVDYFAMTAVFSGVQHGERQLKVPDHDERLRKAAELRRTVSAIDAELTEFEPPANPDFKHDSKTSARMNEERFAPVVATTVRFTIHETAPHPKIGEIEPCIDELEIFSAGDNPKNVALASAGAKASASGTLAKSKSHKLKHLNDGKYGNSHSWISNERGIGWVRIDFPEPTHIDRIVWGRDRKEKFNDRLPTSYTIEAGSSRPGDASNDIQWTRIAGSPPLRPAVHPRQNVERFPAVEAKFVRFTISDTTGLEPCIDELEIYTAGAKPRNVALASGGAKTIASSVYPNSPIHKLEHLNDGRYGNDYSWISSEAGKGWVQVELPEKIAVSKIVWGRDREEKFADRLATQYKIEIATDTNHWQTVAASNDRQRYVAGRKSAPLESVGNFTTEQRAQLRKLLADRKKLEADIKELTTFPMVYAGVFTTPEPTYRLQRGDPMQRKEEIAPGALSNFSPVLNLPANATEQQRRLALARWIVAPENVLTARVLANRLWQHHFGEGIVNTPSDFGINGARPSHPELLDWLATELVRQGWRLKPMHRLMVLSSAYRQSSATIASAAAVDAGNRLLWRFTPRRLEAEPIRDAILTVSGQLDLKMGGPGYHVFEPNDNYVRVYEPKKEFGPAEWRRMVYQYKPRMQQDATFGAFDCPDGGQIAPRRGSSTTPLQALNLLNSRFMMQQATLLAERLEREANTNEERVRRAFALAFNRQPARDELAAANKLIHEQSLTIFCRAMLNANEFLYVF